MIYVFTDGSGFQKFPEPDGGKAYLEISGNDKIRILAGDPYRINDTQDGITFPPIEEVEAERAAAALEAERAAMIVSRFQARAALHNAGLLAQAETAINNAIDPIVKMAWQDAIEFRRMSPTIAALAPQLGLDDAQLDQLFEQAAQIDA